MLHFLNILATNENFNRLHKELKCKRCAGCCSSLICDPAGVVIKEFEIQNIAKYLKTSPSEIKKKTYMKEGKRFIGFPCPFLKEKECTIYPVRPKVCQNFPFNQVYTHKDGRQFMTVAHCPAGDEINLKFGVKV